MKFRPALALSAGVLTLVASSVAASASQAAGSDVALSGSRPAAASTAKLGSVPSGSRIDFSVQLKPRNLAGAKALATAVSTPGNASYQQFLTPAQWEKRFSPTAGQVAEVTAFLKRSGFTVGSVSADRLAVDASGTAAQVEKAFATSLSYHRVQGQKLRLNDRALSVPADLAGVIVGVSGIQQIPAHPANTTDNPATTASNAASSPSIYGPPPPGFRVAPPCGKYYDQLLDTTLPPYGNGFPADPPWAVCGYVPSQFRSAYNEGSADGTGVTVAIIDAYAAPTLFADAQKYASLNDPSHPLTSSQFSEVLAPSFNQGDACGPSGWYGEQTLDVEAVHAMAPGAHIVFGGAGNCFQGELDGMLRTIIDGHMANIVTNSYGDPAGDLLDPPSLKEATDNLLMMAASTGVSVLYSSGDWFDNYTLTGDISPTYPASSPWATGVGGTTLKIGANGRREGELGWSTARSMLCTTTTIAAGACTKDQLNTWLPIDLGLDGGSGGGTSSYYSQPSYQAGVVPTSLSERDSDTPMRVEPDISMAADPATGMLVGETQTFPNGVYYDQYRIGGTSLASPLLAGYIATADQMAGHPLGFLNPALYALYGKSGGLYDVRPGGKQDQSRADYLNGISPGDGFIYWTRIITYQGPEQYCNASNVCTQTEMTLHTAPGYDNMTGLGSPGEKFLSLLTGH